MSLGAGNLQTFAHSLPAGAPFPLTSAENGLSVDPITGRIVLGNDPGAAGDPAQLLSNREIKLSSFYIDYIGNAIEQFFDDATGVFKLFRNPAGVLAFNVDAQGKLYQLGENYRIEINNPLEFIQLRQNSEPFLDIQGAAAARTLALQIGNASMQMAELTQFITTITDVTNANSLRLQLDGVNDVADISNGVNQYLYIDIPNDTFWIGDIPGATSNTYFYLDNRSFTISSQGFGLADGDLINGRYRFGDINNFANGTRMFIRDTTRSISLGDDQLLNNGTVFLVDDINNNVSISNIAGNAGVLINGVAGFTGTVAPVNTITVDGGIVTNVA